MVYDYWLSLIHPVISGWNAQNLTPSPPLIDTVLGFGLMFAGATISLFWQPWRSGRAGRLLTIWFLVGFILLYTPLPFQRRLSMGLYLPMVGLTTWWLSKLEPSIRTFRLTQTAILALSIPSLILVLIAGVSGASRGEPAISYSMAELDAYDWIGSNVESGSLILTDPRYGNRLPAFATVRVLYGHPFETPDAEFWRAEVLSLLSWDAQKDQGLRQLERYGVDWVLIELDEAIGTPTWLDELQGKAKFDDLIVLEKNRR
jgi:hypothetical protein